MNNFDIPWVEKYRPSHIDDIIINENIHKHVRQIIKNKNMPNIIITGLPGIGKTTTMQCICKHFYGKHLREAVLELNASDDRGIKTVQSSIYYFCQKKIKLNKKKYAQHKIVLLDEADNMTAKAQQLINNLMEKYKHSTRFAFTCNDSTQIVEAIQSRCVIFRYTSLTSDQIKKRLREVCEIEKIKYNEGGLNAIIFAAQGDLRRALNYLQLTTNNFDKVTLENVYKLCDKPHPHIIKTIIIECYSKNILMGLKIIKSLLNKGYSEMDIITGMVNVLCYFDIPEIEKKIKMKLLDKICQTYAVLNKGLDSELQLTGCLSYIYKLSFASMTH